MTRTGFGSTPLLLILVLLLTATPHAAAKPAPGPAVKAAAPQSAATAARDLAPGSKPEWLSDSTVVEHWTLANGLRVTTRDAPWARAVAITVAYNCGSDDDPPGRDGQAQTLSELAFTGSTATLPERSRDDLDSQRPYGWSFNATRRMTLLTEVATPSQFPGVLSQVAERMRGVKVTREGLHTAIENTRQAQQLQIYGPPTTSLFFIAREVALGRKEDAMEKHAAGRDLDRLTVTQAQEELARRHVPANASLAIAGNLSDLDVPKLVQNLFGTIPSGAPLTRPTLDTLRAGNYIVQFPRPGQPSWAVGIIAPALTDSIHPAFYLNTLVLFSYFDEIWKAETDPTAGTHSFYALLDEPEMVRIIPPPDAKNMTTEFLGLTIQGAVAGLYREVITKDDYNVLRNQSLWVVGGAMDSTMRDQALKQAAPWHTLARSMAVRELRGGEAFWADYRRRFENQRFGGLQTWGDYYATPEKQVRLLLIPGR